MKQVIQGLFIFLMAILAINTYAQDRSFAIESGAEISLEKDVHHQGTIKQGMNGICHIKFANTGTKTLEISSIEASEGCKVISSPQKPIPAGKQGMITVKYDTKSAGDLEQKITINSNSTSEAAKIVQIKGKIKGEAIQQVEPEKMTAKSGAIVPEKINVKRSEPLKTMVKKGGKRKKKKLKRKRRKKAVDGDK